MTEVSESTEANTSPPSVEELAQSMLALHGAHGEDDHDHPSTGRPNGHWSKAPAFEHEPERAAQLHEATEGDKQRYLTSGLQEVDCRFCHGSVMVKKLSLNHTAVQWNTAAAGRCAFFAQMREEGTNTARVRGCPRLSDSIAHAVAEGCLDQICTAAPPGDG
ncbi:hypothetical protein CCUG60884_01207 [Mycobacteroides salmoniphilum]|uniref:Uncharacterized protein n=1 Tax=Mycobacteroides salmoniphilum TaxID=404941 RepID=A0A4R8SZC8_9MYCO|nr:hypothetical protein CCUG60884_01207 [Mycobacteroides salmoniphilum]